MSSSPDGYDPEKDAHDSYYAAVEAKRLRGDRHWTQKPPPAWRIVSPASRAATLSLAGAGARVRRMVLAQVRSEAVETVGIYRGDDCMAVVYFGRHGWRRREMALSVAPEAARHMGRLVRIAQLTLFAMAETHLIVATVHPANLAGQRMAVLVGFRAARLKQPGVWVLRKERHMSSILNPGKAAKQAAEEQKQQQAIANDRQLAELRQQDATSGASRRNPRGRRLFVTDAASKSDLS
ncbi:hypothetical protein [Mesorhizobium sp. B1-1-7]|uniref:hypothetical protein n=1 Tax=Mesorhizobium sp. B1-1-7 TaxID=2589977 RepID=UPI001127CE0D|nr:hypothetical protein [Mesorhizobium sp. B1-1-7]TPN57163.1 hypothetical protein FJ978_00640 [Mesorhizobium sp. B1-1-7]